MGDRLKDYRDALDYLFVRTTGVWRFGLERTEALLDELGNPHRNLRVIHVGGTNGKGSVCATLEAVLRDRGLRVAKYTSPHLVDFRERFVINGKAIDEAAVVEFIRRWTPTIERIGATFFEATTAMAFDLFARANPDIALIEVGLGGRLDSTNVVDPVLAVVTSIGLDHTEYLGDTKQAIAAEKAGIFKRGRGAVIGEPDSSIRALLASKARDTGASPVHVVHERTAVSDVRVAANGTTFMYANGGGETMCHTGLIGAHQASNTASALDTLAQLPAPWTVSARDAAPSLPAVTLPGRFQIHGRYIFDVAHNRDGAEVLAATLKAVGLRRPCVAVVSVLADKDWRGMIGALLPEVDRIILTAAPTSPASRAWDPAQVLREALASGWPCVLERDFDRALVRALEEGETAVVTGSFHTVGDAMARLHVSPLAG